MENILADYQRRHGFDARGFGLPQAIFLFPQMHHFDLVSSMVQCFRYGSLGIDTDWTPCMIEANGRFHLKLL